MMPDPDLFHQQIDGKPVRLYVLQNKNGVSAAITNFGGCVVSLLVPDKHGNLTDVVLGFSSLEEYRTTPDPYYGAIIGRYANRIANGKFNLNNKQYVLPVNNGENHLHGGPHGFHTVVWEVVDADNTTLQLKYLSTDGEEGYPGNLAVTVVYQLTEANELKIAYEAKADADTVVNLTNHAFFNLNGEGSGSIEQHFLTIDAEYFVPVKNSLIPTGVLQHVKGTPFDFSNRCAIGDRINEDHDQLIIGRGYDHTFVLNTKANELVKCAVAEGDQTGIKMEVFTTEPGMQLYTGNFMMGRNTLKCGEKDNFRTAFCLETQHFPDSPNQPAFPSTLLKKGKVYKSQTVYKFYC